MGRPQSFPCCPPNPAVPLSPGFSRVIWRRAAVSRHVAVGSRQSPRCSLASAFPLSARRLFVKSILSVNTAEQSFSTLRLMTLRKGRMIDVSILLWLGFRVPSSSRLLLAGGTEDSRVCVFSHFSWAYAWECGPQGRSRCSFRRDCQPAF